MADVFRNTFPIAISFSQGELPTATKMQGLATQARNGQGIIQYALGDLWNQGGDNLLTSTSVSTNALMIANLARYIGKAELTNPRIPELANIESYTHSLNGLGLVGEHEFVLAFPPSAAGITFTWGGLNCPTTGTSEASKGAVTAAGEFYVDTETGEVYTFDAVDPLDNWTVEYDPLVKGDISDTTHWNIIPDPYTHGSYTGFDGVKIEYQNGTDNTSGYYIYLPPRAPLTDARMGDRQPSLVAANFDATPDAGDKLLWQDNTVAGSTDETTGHATHYRYNLPNVITSASGWGSGATIPAGLVYLWDSTNTGTIIEGVTMTAESAASPRTWMFCVPYGTTLDTWLASSYGQSAYPESSLTSNSHLPAMYPATGLKVVTVGSDIGNFISSLMLQFLNHDHGSQNSLPSKPVAHDKLTGLFAAQQAPVDVDGNTPQFNPSKLSNDDHIQYLHRGGYGNATTRDDFNNCMFGDLLIASTKNTNNYKNTADDSNKLWFSNPSVTDGAYIYNRWTGSYDELTFMNRTNGSPLDRGYFRFGDPDVKTEGAVILNKYGSGEVHIGTESAGTDVYFYASGGDTYVKSTSGDVYIDAGGGDIKVNADIAWSSSQSISVASPLHFMHYCDSAWDTGQVHNRLYSGATSYWGGTFSVNNKYHLFISASNWPNDFYCTNARFNVYNPAGSSKTFSIWGRRMACDNVGWSWTSTRLYSADSLTFTVAATSWQSCDFTVNSHNTFDRSQDVLAWMVASNYTSGLYLWPAIRLTGTYTKITRWD